MNKKAFDETFKNLMKQYFEKFAIVKTEYEILKLIVEIYVVLLGEVEFVFKQENDGTNYPFGKLCKRRCQ